MTLDIATEIAAGENQHREFKRQLDNPESLAGEIVAFANSQGGTIYLGVADDGQIYGLENVEVTFQTLTNICRDRCLPPISPIINQHRIADKDVLSLTIKPALNRQKPYRTAGGRFYFRVGKDKKDATGRELIRLAQAAGELLYDESPVVGTSLADLSMDTFAAYHRQQFGLSIEEQLEQSNITLETLLHNLHLLHDLEGELTLSVAAVLIFGKSPPQFMPHSRLSAVSFLGQNEDSDILDRQEIEGRLPDIIKETRLFCKRNIRQPAREHGFYREDILLYDYQAIGEAVTNAIAHRDYSLSGSQIRLFLFQDRLEIRSPGRLPNSITLSNIKLGVHAERNRTLVRLLSQMGYMSAIGTGIPRLIIRLSRELSGREPEFELVGEELRVRIWARSS